MPRLCSILGFEFMLSKNNLQNLISAVSLATHDTDIPSNIHKNQDSDPLWVIGCVPSRNNSDRSAFLSIGFGLTLLLFKIDTTEQYPPRKMEQEIGANNDDARKKRDSRSSPTPKDKAKKFRTTLAEENHSNNDTKGQSSTAVGDDSSSSPVAEQGKTPKQPKHLEHLEQKKHATPTTFQSRDKRETTPTNAAVSNNELCRLLDLETALHRLIGDENSTKEYLTETSTEGMEDRDYITFRWAHAGDAAKIAAWHRGESHDGSSNSSIKDVNNKTSHTTSTTSKKKNEGEDDSQLELWLSDGLGDEDHPPFLFALLAHVVMPSAGVSSNNTSAKIPKLAACALLTLAWEEGKRLLRVEWRHVDTSLPHSDLISRRLWLRLSSLALMSACTLAIEKDGTINNNDTCTVTDNTPANLNNSKAVALE